MKIVRLFTLMLFSFLMLNSCLQFDTLLTTARNYDETNQTCLVSSDDGYLYRSYAIRGATTLGASKIEKVNINTGVATTILGSGNLNVTDGIGLAAEFKQITALAFIPGSPQKLLVGDYCTLREVNLSTLQVTTKAGASGNCASDTNGTGTAARFTSVRGLVVSGTTLLVATSNQIKQVSLSTYTVSSYIGSSTAGDTDGVGTSASITPLNMTKLGNIIYLMDSAKKIKKISLNDLSVTTIVGQTISGTTYNSQDGVGTNATLLFSNMNALSSDNNNYLYFTESQKIRRLNLTTYQVTTILNSYGQDEDIDSTDLGLARIFRPSGLVFTNQGLFVSTLYGIRRLK